MKIAIFGGGRIGSTFALYLARGGHDVTVIARGKRLEELQGAGAIVPVTGEPASVKAAGALEPSTPFDLVLVTLLAHQLEPALPALKASAAKTVMFMFNTVAPLAPLRDAVGTGRAAFAFPVVTAAFVDGKLKSSVAAPGQLTTTSRGEWSQVFAAAGIPANVEQDMESYLRCHAAWVIPLMMVGGISFTQNRRATWAEARRAVRAQDAGFRIVRKLGHRLIPGFVWVFAALPGFLLAALYWLLSGTAAVKELGALGPTELRELVDALAGLAPEEGEPLRAIRP